MVCLKNGASTISFMPKDDCCKEEKPSQPALATNCCDNVNFAIILKDYNFSEKNSVPAAAVLCIAICGYSFAQPQPAPFYTAKKINNPRHALHGRELLSFISTLLI